MSYLDFLPDMLDALARPNANTGQSPLDSLQAMTAGVAAAAGSGAGQQSLLLSRQFKQQQLENQMRQKQLDLATQNAQGEAALRNAQIGNLNSEVAARQNPVVKPKEESWDIVPNIQGPNGEAVQQERNSGQVRLVGLPGLKPAAPKTPNAQPFADDKLAQGNKILGDAYRAFNPGMDVPGEFQMQAGATPEDYTRILTGIENMGRAAEQRNQHQFQQNQAEQNRQDRLDKQNQATNDEKKRADLAKNVNENLDRLDDIVTRRPDIFGKVGGRITQAREWLGTNDPDIGALKNISDNLGMAQQSAHGMRSAHHIEQSANSILNSYKNGPDATKAAIQSARSSVQTFLNDVGEGPYSHPRAANQGGSNTGGNSNSGTVSVTDPNGGVHTFPDQASADRFKKLAGIL